LDLKTYEHLVQNELFARKFLLSFCWKNQQRFCTKCRSRSFTKLEDGRRRCKRCGYLYHDFSGRWINLSRLAPDQWLRVVKLFELELPASTIARQAGIAYNTAHRAVTVLRMAILAHGEDASSLLPVMMERGGPLFGGRRQGGDGSWEVPVFGLASRGGEVVVRVIPGCKTEDLLDLAAEKARHGDVLFPDRFKAYDSLLYCGFSHLAVDHEENPPGGKVRVTGLEGFWSFAKERLMKHHGVSRKYFPLYLKELEFRYNHRQQDLFDRLCQYLCNFVPDVG